MCIFVCEIGIVAISSHDLWAAKPLKRIYKSWMCDRVNAITMQHHINSTAYIYDSCFAFYFQSTLWFGRQNIVRSVWERLSNIILMMIKKDKCADICRIVKMEIYTIITLDFIINLPMNSKSEIVFSSKFCVNSQYSIQRLVLIQQVRWLLKGILRWGDLTPWFTM